MKKLKIICVLALVLGLLVPNVIVALEYKADFLEPGNPGGWETGKKTWDDGNPNWKMAPGDSISVDIWIKDVQEPLLSGGLWITFDSSKVSVTKVEIYDGGKGGIIGGNNTLTKYGSLAGPWNKDMSGIAHVKTGQILITAGTIAQVNPDKDGGVIICSLTFKHKAAGNAAITLNATPKSPIVVGTVSSMLDSKIPDKHITIHGQPSR